MRVISGVARGRKLQPVPGDSTRPILDRVKTALFDILRPSLAQTTWLDLFAGSGAVGIEALSQGAKHCTFIDIEREAVMTIKRNLAATNLEKQAKVVHTDAFSFLKSAKGPYDAIYVAPPQYHGIWLNALYALAERPHLVSAAGRIIVQIDPSEYEPVCLTTFNELEQRRYGSTLLVFYGSSPLQR